LVVWLLLLELVFVGPVSDNCFLTMLQFFSVGLLGFTDSSVFCNYLFLGEGELLLYVIPVS
jgi:hypothetical protein